MSILSETDLKEIERRTVRYWFEDGIYQMAIGVFEIVLGVFCWLFTKIPADLAWRAAWFLCAGPIIVVSGRLFLGKIKPLKEKFTYPRAGFVAYQKRERGKFGLSTPGLILGLIGGLAFSLGRAILEPTGLLGLPLIAGAFGAGISIWLTAKTGLWRYLGTTGICLIAGAGLSLARMAEMAALGAFWAILGFFGILLGGSAFLRFLRRHPSPDADPS